MKNPDCDNEKCLLPNEEVRILPTGGDSNAFLCRVCFGHEIAFRIKRNQELGKREKFKIPKWDDLKVYKPIS